MLDAAVIARINEIVGDNKCQCGEPADRFRKTQGRGDVFYCHSCFHEADEECETISHKRTRASVSRIDDPDNMPDLFWTPPLRRIRREALQRRRSA
jgi:hypothetical protein